MNSPLDIVIAGVGGQGTVLASRVLAQAALNFDLPARTSETIGMAQREGSVQSHLRIGSDEFGPLISHRRADILLGFEPAEAQRSCNLLKPSGFALINIHPVSPVTVALGTSTYPIDEIRQYMCSIPVRTIFINAFELAVVAGNFRTVNAVMLGALASTGLLPMDGPGILKVLLEMLPERVRDVNKRAFELGSKALEEDRHD
jgi:indolepyruvate ferredoxin oxidoreductase, beta subunit